MLLILVISQPPQSISFEPAEDDSSEDDGGRNHAVKESNWDGEQRKEVRGTHSCEEYSNKEVPGKQRSSESNEIPEDSYLDELN